MIFAVLTPFVPLRLLFGTCRSKGPRPSRAFGLPSRASRRPSRASRQPSRADCRRVRQRPPASRASLRPAGRRTARASRRTGAGGAAALRERDPREPDSDQDLLPPHAPKQHKCIEKTTSINCFMCLGSTSASAVSARCFWEVLAHKRASEADGKKEASDGPSMAALALEAAARVAL